MFDRQKFHELETKYGPFTLDAAAADDGSNAQCKNFCSPAKSFMNTDCKGQTIWMNPPFDRIDEFLGHYRTEKNKDPSIAGMFILPKWEDAHWWSKVTGWSEVCTYEKGTDIFTAPAEKGQLGGRRHLGPIRWPVVVLWDAPQTALPAPFKVWSQTVTLRRAPSRTTPTQRRPARETETSTTQEPHALDGAMAIGKDACSSQKDESTGRPPLSSSTVERAWTSWMKNSRGRPGALWSEETPSR